ncbi:MAG TPA: AMP-binding protein [Ktedonobacteraceae bacterium]|nr:AMP-binding protein [Ktedonobacteraceae bacterium]
MTLNEFHPLSPPFTPHTLLEISQWRASQQAEEQIYTFLANDRESISLTYAELDRRARAVAAKLQSLQADDERVLLLYPPGMEYIVAFFGCLYAGAVAVPAYPPHMNRSISRLLAIIEDAQPKVILTDTRTIADIRQRFSATIDRDAMQWIAIESLEEGIEDMWQSPCVTENSLAFLQYSSGSTGAPKGVMLSHKNILHNVAHLSKRGEHTLESRGVTWLPPYHDMGLIGGIIQPLYAGFPTVCMSSTSFLQRPIRWLQAISTYRATHSVGPNFAYAHCVKKITPEECVSLDLSCWRVAYCGAEPVHAETLERFAATFAPHGFKRQAFYPCYGLAEATLIATGGLAHAEPVITSFDAKELRQNRVVPASPSSNAVKTLVGCGQILPDQQLRIVDPQTLQECPPDRVGEIWISGPSIAQGYWNKPAESSHTFGAFIADTGEGPFLRTGDAGFLVEEELFVAARLKDLIILHGNNYYPQDIEATTGTSHPALRQNCTAAFSIEVENEERLIIVQEIDRQHRDLDVEAICQIIREAVLYSHDIVAHTIVLIKHGSIPKTSSGKIQRFLCREEFLAQRLNILGTSTIVEAQESQHIAPRNPLEQALVDIWKEVLGIEQVGVDDNFFALGGESLMATELISRMQDTFQREIPLRILFENATIAGIVQGMETLETEEEEDAEPELVPLGRMQYLSVEL